MKPLPPAVLEMIIMSIDRNANRSAMVLMKEYKEMGYDIRPGVEYFQKKVFPEKYGVKK